VSNLTRL